MNIHHSEDRITITEFEPKDRVYINVLYECMQVYADRSEEYGSGYRRYGFMGACFFVKDRANRLWDAARLKRIIQERDAHDVINYAAIALISSREDNYGGEFWPEQNND